MALPGWPNHDLWDAREDRKDHVVEYRSRSVINIIVDTRISRVF